MPQYRISESGRILPDSLDDELPRLPMRLAGIAFLVIAAVGWISLLGWSFSDPSINRAVDGVPQNFLGSTGASLADMLLQILGLTSIAVFLPPAAWGIALLSGERIMDGRHRLAMWTLSLILISSALSVLPSPDGWLLPHGMGGLIGDFGKSVFLGIFGFLQEPLVTVLSVAAAGIPGLWTLMRASGISTRERQMFFETEDSPDNEGIGFGGGFAGYIGHRIASAFRAMPGLSARSAEASGAAYPQDWDAGTAASRTVQHGFANAPQYRPRATSAPHADAPFQGPQSTIVNHASAMPERQEPYFEGHRMIRINPPHQADERAVPMEQPPVQPQSEVFSAPQQPITPQNAQQFARAEPPDQQHQWIQAPRQPVSQPQYEPPQVSYSPGFTAAAPQTQMVHQRAQYAAQPSPPHAYNGTAAAYPQQQPVQAFAPEPAYANENFNHTGAARHSFPGHGAQTEMASRASTAPARKIRFQDWNAEDFMMPPLDLLASPPPHQSDPELSDAALGRRAELLQSVLEDFRVKGQITGVYPGPVITLYEFEPARGTKSSRIIGLADDIARSMSATSARVAVIPGRDALGIELPNRNRETVYLRELLESKDFLQGKGRLQLALGKTIGGDPVIVDLARMPHLLIAGTTGSGKSVAINTMILSLLYRLPPEECRFIMIDPKMLELSVYDGIPHLLTPVVTDPHKAIRALKWTVNEMNVRYERMCKLGVRNIMGFNQKVTRAARKGEPLFRPGQEVDNFDATPMPYIVVVIDEMADLMMVAGKDIEFAVQRLSQMARAAGIHLIMATQRPSVDVITGTIKANFPSRISFQVTSKIDSRTILGEQGAEQLLGAGDMLTMAAGGRIMRAHGPFVSDDEVETIAGYLRDQGEPDYMDGLVDEDVPMDDESGNAAQASNTSNDDIYSQAIEIVMRDRRPTTSYLQRRLGIGYNRAASLIEQMESDGIISAPNRTGKREVLAGEAS